MMRPSAVAEGAVGALPASRVFVGAAVRSLAIPKSRSFTFPLGVIITFSGFRSRWTMPFWCAAPKPWAISFAIRTVSG